jgi:hypothetical protein
VRWCRAHFGCVTAAAPRHGRLSCSSQWPLVARTSSGAGSLLQVCRSLISLSRDGRTETQKLKQRYCECCH